MSQLYNEFWKENQQLISLHIFLEIIILPIEIAIFSGFTKYLFKSLSDRNFKRFIRLFMLFIFFLTLLQIIYGIKEYVDNKVTPKVQVFIRGRCTNKYLRENKEDFQNSEVMNKIVHLPKSFYANYESVLKFWIPFLSAFFFYTIFLCWVNINVGIISIFMFSTLITLFLIVFQKLTFYSNNVFKENQELLSYYEDTIVNNETIQNYNNYTYELKKLNEKEEKYEQKRLSFVFYINLTRYCFIVFLFVFLIIIFFYLYELMNKNPKKLPPWKFITFVSILFFIVRMIIGQLVYFLRVVTYRGNINISDNLTIILKETNKNVKLNNYTIEIKNITFSYPKNMNKIILDNFSLVIPENSNLLIKGSIGSGKSTIGRLLSQSYKPQKGNILIGGIDLYSIPKEQYTNFIFIMSQNTILFSNKSVFENICYPFEKKVNKNILDKFNLPSSFLDILDQKVIHQGTNISGGQKRMIYIIRAFLHKAPVVILDEPTDSLDEKTTMVIISLLKQIIKEKTLICISHDSRLFSIFSRQIELS